MQRRGVTTLVHKKSWQILGMGPLAWIQSALDELNNLIHLLNGSFEDDPELAKFPSTNGDNGVKIKFHIDGTQIPEPSSNMAQKKVTGKFLKARMLSRVFSEDYDRILGACWYLLSIERQEACWRSVCDLEKSFCQYGFFDCHRVKDALRVSWFMASNITNLCSPNANDDFYQFGIYADAVTSKVTSSAFFNKYFFCLWWGLRNLR
ncbi:hypothetical protein JHK87_037880 [Glycine soja]|nr:hypothetical protein JHK87_037880 [Glycine soja]